MRLTHWSIAVCGAIAGAAVVPSSGFAQSSKVDSSGLAPITMERSALNLTGPSRPGPYVGAIGRRAIAVGTEQGGFEIWAWPVKLLHNLDLTFRTSPLDDPVSARALARKTEITPSGAVITYTHPAFTVRQQIFAALNEPAVIMVLDVDAARPLELQAEFVPDLQLAWPGAIGGQYAYWDEADRAFLLSESQRSLNAYVGSPMASSAAGQTEPGMSEAPLRLRIALGGVGLEPSTKAKPSAHQELHLRGIPIVFVGAAAPRDSVKAIYQRVLSNIPALYAERTAHARAVLDSTIWTESPDPRLDLALRWAALNLDEALACNPDVGCGLVAGYGPSQSRGARPGFAWYFGSDAAVTGLGLLASGRYGLARQGLDFFTRYQRSDGRVPHEVSQSAGRIKWFEDFPYAFYHAEDTPWWIVGWGEYWRETGDTAALRQAWPAIKRAYQWSRSVSDSSSGLMLNSKAGLGAVDAGSLGTGVKADIYLTAVWIEALGRFAEMAEWAESSSKPAKGSKSSNRRAAEPPSRPLSRLATDALNLRTRALATLRDRFWVADSSMYAFALREQDKPRVELTAWPSLVLAFGLPDEDRGMAAAAAQARATLNTDWGTRSLASQSQSFDPLDYSNGTVWPFTTGLTALGQYRYRNPAAGYQALSQLVETGFAAGLGKNPEVFSGTVYEPLTTAVPQQFFGTALIPTVVTRGLLGWKPDVPHHTIELSPQLPAEWDRLVVHHAAAGENHYEIELKRSGRTLTAAVRPEGTVRGDTLVFRPHLPVGSKLGDVRVKGGLPLSSAEPRQTARDLELTIKTVVTGPVEITVEFEPGYEVSLPVVVPARGDRSRGIRLLDQRLVGDALVLTLEGPAGATDTLSVRHGEPNQVPVSFPAPGDSLDGYSKLVLNVPLTSLH
jgi:glycogen debranching enzyme